MSYVFRTFGCPDCDHEFEVFQKRDDPPPDFCPRCESDMMGDPMVPHLPLPRGGRIIGSPIARAADMTYRQLEDSTAAMAEEHGNPAMKVTDLKDNLRVGDVAAKPAQVSKTYADIINNTPYRPGFGQMGGGMGSPGDIVRGAKAQRDPELRRAGDVLQGASGDMFSPHRGLTGNLNRSAAMKDAGKS